MSKRRGYQTAFSVGSTPVLLLPANPQRRSWIVSPDGSFGILLSLNGPNAGQVGLYLRGGVSPLLVAESDFGELVQQDVWAVQFLGDTPNANTSVTVWQTEDCGFA